MVFLNAHGQQGSRNLLDEYCKANWQKDPTRCANYVPKDYQPQQSQGIQQSIIQSNPTTNDANRICPLGSYLGKDSFGNQACLDSHTNQVVTSPDLNQIPSNSNGIGDSGTIIGIVVFVVIVAIIAGIAKSRSKSKPTEYRDVKRKDFSFATKEMVKEQQKGRCVMCDRIPTHWEFDHIDGRGDNGIDNCQGLCRDCHQSKTLKDNW